jgi:SpoVK/Ycf46/Vps4 family AAA+-type ATPase
MEPNASNWLALWIALSTATLETTLTLRSGSNTEAAQTRERSLADAIEAMRASASDLPAVLLRTRLALSTTEERVIWLLVATELSMKVRELACTVADASQPTMSMLLEAVYGGTVNATGWSELAPTGRLRSFGLVERSDSGDERVPDTFQTFKASSRARELALGRLGIPDELAPFATLDPESLPIIDVVVDETVKQQVVALVPRTNALLLVTGQRGTGKTTLVRSAARASSGAIIEVDAARIAPSRAAARLQLASVAREARLHEAGILVTDLDALLPDGTSADDRLDLVDTEVMRRTNKPIYATATVRPNGLVSSRPVICVTMMAPTTVERRELWKRAIPTAAESDIQFLAETYPLSAAMIYAVGRAIAARRDGRPTADEVLSSIDAVVDDNLRGLADRIVITQTWDDLVLPREQLEPIKEIVARVRQRGRVYEQWGFANKLGKGLGVTALISGPPGTGKTMLAGLIAKELGLALYQVDLSKMVSKWIGETEKNLARLFDAAESGHAVLLFDEADSMFGKRTDVKSSNDRNANLEVNYLLQRIERFSGICILTTNHETSIDPAFRRRLAFHIRFDTPDEAERELLWRTLIPSGAPVAADIDFASLARKFEMPGGHIRNAVLRAAFLASDAGSSISMAHLWRSAINEYESMGKVSYSNLL